MSSIRQQIMAATFVCVICLAWGGTVTTRDGKGYSGLVKFLDAEHLSISSAKGQMAKVALTNVVRASFEPPANANLLAQGGPAGRGIGLLATYHDRPNFKGRVIHRVDKHVEHNWGTRQAMHDLPQDYFTVRWTGELEAPATGEYTIFLEANDGGRVELGDQLKFGQWEALAGFRAHGVAKLEAGKRYPLTVEVFDNYGSAHARLLWSGPGLPKSPVPAQQLYPAVPGMKNSSGLLGAFFKNRFFYGDAILRADATVNFATGLQPPEGFPDKNYSARWTGQVEPSATGIHEFHVEADQGVRLWVDGRLLINSLGNRFLRTFTGEAPLNKGDRYNILLETVQRDTGQKLVFKWAHKGNGITGAKLHAVCLPPVNPPEGGDAPEDVQLIGVRSWGGSHIAQEVLSADDATVRFGLGQLPERMSLVNVARITFRPIPERHRDGIGPKRRGVLLRNGSFVEGELAFIKEGWLGLDTVLLGLKLYTMDEMLAVQVNELKDKPPFGTRFTVQLGNGTLLHARAFKPAEDKLIVDDPTVGELNIPLRMLEEIRRLP